MPCCPLVADLVKHLRPRLQVTFSSLGFLKGSSKLFGALKPINADTFEVRCSSRSCMLAWRLGWLYCLEHQTAASPLMVDGSDDDARVLMVC